MEEFLTIALTIAVVVVLAVRGGSRGSPAGGPPPPLPRRVHRPRVSRPTICSVSQEVPDAPLPSAIPASPSETIVVLPACVVGRRDFSGKDALRRAVVAREVLGPPLALRPPRF